MSVHHKLKSNKMKKIISGSITTQTKSFMIMWVFFFFASLNSSSQEQALWGLYFLGSIEPVWTMIWENWHTGPSYKAYCGLKLWFDLGQRSLTPLGTHSLSLSFSLSLILINETQKLYPKGPKPFPTQPQLRRQRLYQV